MLVLRTATRYLHTRAEHTVGSDADWRYMADRVLPGAIEREHAALLEARRVFKQFKPGGKPGSKP